MSHNSILVVEEGNIPGDVPIDFQGNTGTGATAVANLLYILGIDGTTVDTTGQTITIKAISSGFTWNTVTSVLPTNPIQLVAENGYICAGSSMVTFLLPLAPSVGDTFKIFSYTSRFQIIPNGGQNMVIGTVTGIAGSSGTVTSQSAGDMITFTYMGGNTFESESPQGTFLVTTS